MIHFAWLILRKDLRLLLARGNGFFQAVLLGLLLVFIFSMAGEPGQSASPQDAAAIFWLSSTFCLCLVFTTLYGHDDINGIRAGLLLSPMPLQAIWLGKTIAGLIACGLAQIIFIPAILIFLNQSVPGPLFYGLLALLLANPGICILGSLLGALSHGRGGAETLLSIILFPMLVPMLLAGIALGSLSLGGGNPESANLWLALAGAFDAIYAAAALLCFPFLYKGDA